MREYLENNFNKNLTTEIVRADIRAAGALTIKDWSLDPTLAEKLRSETKAYLESYSPFGAGGFAISRSETDRLADLITKSDGPTVVLLP